VRELRNVLERAVIVAGEGSIEPAHLPPGFGGTPAVRPAAADGDLRIPLGYTIEQAERALIEMTLEHTKNNKTRAAEILGISQKTLFNKLKEYGSHAAGLVQTAD
jgi:DNA-binding NtrC family response regulator